MPIVEFLFLACFCTTFVPQRLSADFLYRGKSLFWNYTLAKMRHDATLFKDAKPLLRAHIMNYKEKNIVICQK